MNYYKLGINSESNKWKGYMNASSFVLDEHGNELSDVKLASFHGGFDGELYFSLLSEGKVPPVISIGSRLLAFNSNVFKGDGFGVSGANLVRLSGGDGCDFLLLHVCNYIDCVDWGASKYDSWPSGYVPEEWENMRGRFFIEPVLRGNMIPSDLDVFRLLEWGGAFNIIISERFKAELLSFDFDSSFLDFKKLVVR